MLPRDIEACADDGKAAVLRLDDLAPVHHPEPRSVLPRHPVGGLKPHARLKCMAYIGPHLRHVVRMNRVGPLSANARFKVLPAVIAHHPDHAVVGIVQREARLAVAADHADVLGIGPLPKVLRKRKPVRLHPLKDAQGIPLDRVADHRIFSLADLGEDSLHPVPVKGIVVHRAVLLRAARNGTVQAGRIAPHGRLVAQVSALNACISVPDALIEIQQSEVIRNDVIIRAKCL